MNAQLVLENAIHGSANWVDEKYWGPFTKLAAAAFSATDTARVLRADETAAACVAPASVEVDGKDRDGLILCLEDRAVIAWYTGLLRVKSFQAEVPYASVTSTETGSVRGQQTLAITVGSQTWQLTLDAIHLADMSKLRDIIEGILAGSVEVGYEQDDEE